LHIEHSGAAYGFHALTNGKEKYIWFSQSGREQFFDLQNDPSELHDLIESAPHQNRIADWRKMLIQKLDKRPENFVQKNELAAGQSHTGLVPSQN